MQPSECSWVLNAQPVHIFLAATAEITFSVCVWGGGDTKQYHQHGYGFILSFKMVFI